MHWKNYYKEWTVEDYERHIKAWKGYAHRIMEQVKMDQPILEIGSGTGQISIYLSKAGYDVMGIDMEPELVKRSSELAKKLKAPVKFMIGDIFDKDFDPGRCSLSFSQGLLEHFDDKKIYEFFERCFGFSDKIAFCVPLDKYGRQNKGDERLMSQQWWRDRAERYKIMVWKTFANDTQLMGILSNGK